MLTCVCASVTGAILGKQGADWPRSSLRMGHSLPSVCPVTLSQLPQLGLFLQMVMLLTPALPLEAPLLPSWVLQGAPSTGHSAACSSRRSDSHTKYPLCAPYP